jgi:hypothetical protein
MKQIILPTLLSFISLIVFGQSITLDPKTNSQASLTLSDAGNLGTNMPRIFGQRALGATSSPLAVTNGTSLFSIFGNGYKGSSYGSGASIRFFATENWTSSASGGGIAFGTQDNGSVSTLSEKMRINHNGNVGIGTPDPSAKLEVNGFTMLGEDAPKIKVKKFTGTTASTQGAFTTITTGIPIGKIISVDVLVESANNVYYHHSYTQFAGLEFNFYTNTSGNITLYNVTGNSGSILSKNYKALITYEE